MVLPPSFFQDGSKAVCKGNPSSSSQILLKPHKAQKGPSKKILWDHGRLPSMKDDILELLHDFLNQFLSGGYNGICSGIYSSYIEILLSIDYTSNIYHELNSCQIWWSRSVKILRRSIMQSKTVTLLFSFRLLSLLLLFNITSILLPRWDMRYLFYICVFDRNSIFSDGFNLYKSLFL